MSSKFGVTMNAVRLYLRRYFKFNVLYVLAFALIAFGAFLFIRQVPKDMQWQQSIGALILGSGFTFLITTISAGRSILEENRKAANLERKREVCGPLHAELKELREIFAALRSDIHPILTGLKFKGITFTRIYLR